METAVVTGWFWVLYADTSTGCDVIARGVRAYPNPPAARAAARALAGTGPAQVLSVQDADGCWRWCLYGDDGAEAAVSAGRFAGFRCGSGSGRQGARRRPGMGSDQAGTRRAGAGSA